MGASTIWRPQAQAWLEVIYAGPFAMSAAPSRKGQKGSTGSTIKTRRRSLLPVIGGDRWRMAGGSSSIRPLNMPTVPVCTSQIASWPSVQQHCVQGPAKSQCAIIGAKSGIVMAFYDFDPDVHPIFAG